MKIFPILGGIVLAYCLADGTFKSSVCSEPVLVEILYPEVPKPDEGPFRVVTLNMARESDPEGILRVFEDRRFLAEADVVFLQEVVHSPEQRGYLDALVEQLRWNAVFASTSRPTLDGRLEGIAILSRRPLRDPTAFALRRFGLRIRSRCRLALAATVETPFSQPCRVFGVHLDTRINSGERIKQMLPILDAAERFDGPVVIGGDFNTNNIYWVQHLLPLPFADNQPGKLRDFFEERGFSTPVDGTRPTFNILGLKLDWIYSRKLEGAQWGVEPIPFSDHRAVWVEIPNGRSSLSSN